MRFHRSVGIGTNVIHYKWLRFANNNLLNALMVCLDVTTWKYIVAAILLDSRELCLPWAVSCFICFSSATFEIQSSASYATSSLWLDCAKDNQLVVTELTKRQRLNRRYKPGRHTLPKCLTPLPKQLLTSQDLFLQIPFYIVDIGASWFSFPSASLTVIKSTVTPLLMHWCCCCLTLNHRYGHCPIYAPVIRNYTKYNNGIWFDQICLLCNQCLHHYIVNFASVSPRTQTQEQPQNVPYASWCSFSLEHMAFTLRFQGFFLTWYRALRYLQWPQSAV